MRQLESRPRDNVTVIGVSAPQGAGKTTLTTAMVEALKAENIKAIAVSIDDFYLTHEEQLKVASRNSGNIYLQQRGYPGTHDLKLGCETLKGLTHLKNGEMLIPRYDKSAFQGQGDRSPQNQWTKISGPLDLILFEGWMLAFDVLEYEPWWKFLNALIYLRAKDHHYVLDWRVEAEQKMRASGKPGMTDEQVSAYAQKFMPAYEKWQNTVPEMAKKLRLAPNHYLEIQIGKNRQPQK